MEVEATERWKQADLAREEIKERASFQNVTTSFLSASMLPAAS